MQPDVSVIIPIYNTEKYLPDCLNSVLNQSLENIEVICINDASTDNSLEILKRYERCNRNILVLQNDANKGLSYTRNRGLENAKGKYVYFLDSDDMITADAMKELFCISEENDSDVITFDAKLLFANKDLERKFRAYKKTRKGIYHGVYKGNDFFEKSVENDDWISSVPRYFIRRETLIDLDLRFYEGILHEDELFTFLLINQIQRIVYVNKAYFIRRFRENSIMTEEATFKSVSGSWHVLKEILAYRKLCEERKVLCGGIDGHIQKCVKILVDKYEKIINEQNLNIEALNTYGELESEELITWLALLVMYRGTYVIMDDISPLREGKDNYIYGTGTVAKRMLKCLENENIVVSGFIVSNPKDNPRVFRGRKVIGVEEFFFEKRDANVILGVSDQYKEEVKEELLKRGFEGVVDLMLARK